MRRKADRRRELQVPEERDTAVRIDSGNIMNSARSARAAATYAQQLDFREDEAIPAAMLAHHAVQMRKALQVVHLFVGRLRAHAGIPLVVGFNKPYHAAAAVAEDGLLVVGLVVRDEFGLLARVGLGLDGTHRHVRVALGDFESGVYFHGEMISPDVVEGGFGVRLEVGACGLRKRWCWDRYVQEGEKTGNGADSGHVEVCPAAEVADVPPKVSVYASTNGRDATDKSGRWV